MTLPPKHNHHWRHLANHINEIWRPAYAIILLAGLTINCVVAPLMDKPVDAVALGILIAAMTPLAALRTLEKHLGVADKDTTPPP